MSRFGLERSRQPLAGLRRADLKHLHVEIELTAQTGVNDVLDCLEKLGPMFKRCLLTPEEFATMKSKLIAT